MYRLFRITLAMRERKKRIYDSLRLSLPNSEYLEYEDFTPKKEMVNGKEYLNVLEWALKNFDIKNIALSGPYGSGKSSIIQSYMQLHPSMKALNISFATFNLNEKASEGLTTEEENEIELGILKQLFYKVASKDIPQSRYRKLHRVRFFPYARNIGILSSIIILILSYFLPEKNQELLGTYLLNSSYWGIKKTGAVMILILCWLFGVFSLTYIYHQITTKFHLKEENFADKATISEKGMKWN